MGKDRANILNIAKQVFHDEVDGVMQVFSHLDENFTGAVEAVLSSRGKVIVTGMGKSGHIARKIAATLASTGTPAFFVHPAEAMHGDLGMIEEQDVAILISYSGESEEVLAILPALKRKRVPLISMTAGSTSQLARMSDYCLNIKIDKEACPLGLAPTTSTTVSLVLGDALAIALLSMRDFKPEDFAVSHPGGSLGRRLLTRATDLMHTGNRLPIVRVDTPLKSVVMEISAKGLGFVGVLDAHDVLVGVVTDGDLRRVFDRSEGIAGVVAHEVMSKSPKVIKDTSLAVEAIELMEKYKITGFLVVNESGSLVGAFNLHDLIQAKLI